MKKMLATAFIISLLPACATVTPETIAGYNKMSCLQLGQEMGKHQQQKTDAEATELGSTLGMIFSSSKKSRNEAEIDNSIASIDKMEAEEHLTELDKIIKAKGCR